MKLRFKKWTEEEFFQMREEVLKGWPTGKDVDLEEAIKYHKSLPESKSFSKKLIDAKKAGITLAQPRAGVALIDQHIELLNFLDKEGGADLLPSTIDSYTRQNKYENCEKGIEESIKAGRSLLNGFPGVNHGVAGCRKVVEATSLPLQLRHGTPDARLLSEIMIAAGFTSDEGGGISYNVPYAKSVSLEKTLIDWQYVDRLVGWYEEHGVSINREPFGPLTGTLVPPSMSNAVGILEGLMAAEQGVKNLTLGYGQCGNLIQDVAAIRALEEQAEDYFKNNFLDLEGKYITSSIIIDEKEYMELDENLSQEEIKELRIKEIIEKNPNFGECKREDLSLGCMVDEMPLETTFYDNEGGDGKSVDMYSYTTMIAGATKHLINKVETLEKENEIKDNKISELEQRLEKMEELLNGIINKG